MRKILFIMLFSLLANVLFAHEDEATIKDNSKFFKGGFGELHYNQPIGKNSNKNGHLDVHRLVVGMGYAFTDNFYFFGEVAYEHIEEVMIEQVFVNYEINHSLNLRAGLLPIPMGIVNQEHRPDLFNGVEHPATNMYIVPTAWREFGVGLTGESEESGFAYQLYLINGFASYKDGEARATGETAFRTARQNGVESFVSSPNITGRIEYHGVSNLKVGMSAYFGKTQSELYDTVSENTADSTVLNLKMFAVDARYKTRGFQARAEFMYADVGNVKEYNAYTSQDLGSAFMGYYGEIGYNVLKLNNKGKSLIPFVRYAKYNTHHKVEDGMVKNKAYEREFMTFGVSYFMNKNVILKADYEKITDANDQSFDMLNFGINFVF